MSNKNPIDLRLDRRQWIVSSATALGASLVPLPAIAQQPSATHAATAGQHAAHSPAAAGHFFTPAQHALVEEISETILPADSRSGGAKAAKVADSLDKLLHESPLDDSEKSLWHEGLRLIDSMSHHINGKSFVEASPDDRIAVLTVLSDNDHMTDLTEVRLFNELKRLTVGAYYTSKIGIHDELQYKGNRINQEFYGCDDQPKS
jgi:hypothetical protein